MEDLLGIAFMAVMFFVAVYAKANKEAKRGAGQRQQWPGPVAGPGPMYPRPPRPMMPPVPSRTPASPYASRSQSLDSVGTRGEGVRMDGLGQSDEGPRGDETVDAELQRFNRSLNQFEGQHLPEMREELEDRHLAELQSNIDGSAASAGVGQGTTEPAAAMDLTGMLADRSSLATAVVLAEVLGKPKALRGRR